MSGNAVVVVQEARICAVRKDRVSNTRGKLSAFTLPVSHQSRSRLFKSPSAFCSFAFVFFQRLNSLQELQLLEIMCNYFQEQTKDSVRQIIFSALFSPQGNKADDSRMALLGKLVSMAVAVCRVPVLECAAFWLQVQLLGRQDRSEGLCCESCR